MDRLSPDPLACVRPLLVVVDTSPLLAAGLAAHLLSSGRGHALRAPDAVSAAGLVAGLRPDVVLAALPDLAASLDVVRVVAPLRCVVRHWSTRADDLAAVRASGAAYVPEDAPHDRLLDVLEGREARHPGRSGAAPVEASRRRSDPVLLTRREQEVVDRVLAGASTRQVALELGIATQTVKNHLAKAMGKAGVTSRVQLYAWAAARDLAPRVS